MKEKKVKLSTKQKAALFAATPYFVVALLLVLVSAFIIDLYTPHQATTWSWNGVLMFLVVCAGLGWVIHGVGFLLVKVN